MGPTLAQGDLRYGEVRTSADLPVGWGDDEAAGSFRLIKQGERGKNFASKRTHNSTRRYVPGRTA